MSAQASVKRLTLSLTTREDGGLHISSPDVLGMHLSGADPIQVWTKVAPAITALLLENYGQRVSHIYLPAEEVALSGPSPREIAAHARCTTVMVELEEA